MSNREITVKFTYEAEDKGSLKCKPEEKIKDVCQKFASENGIDFNNVNILFKGTALVESNSNKTLDQLISNIDQDVLKVMITKMPTMTEINLPLEINSMERLDKEINVYFIFGSNRFKFESNLQKNMRETARTFANNNEKGVDSFKFFYGNQELLDLSKTFGEIANERDKNEGKIEINVVEKNNIEEKDGNDNQISFFQKHKLKLLIGLIIALVIIVALIVVLVVLLTKKKKDEENGKEINENVCDDKCLECYSNSECYKCKDEYELYNGKCIQYAFTATFNYNNTNTNNTNDWFKIFNPNRIGDIYAMKIAL